MGRNIETVKWFSSDHHFGHKNIIQYENRPFKTLDKMDEYMIAKWNQCVQPDDVCYIIGDFSFRSYIQTVELVQKLHGRKHLIWGNHDDWNRNRLMKLFDSVYDQAIIQLSNKIRVKLSHFPYVSPDENPDRLRNRKFRPYNEGHWLLHGHVHSLWKINRQLKCINVGVDVWDFKPINHDKILAIINGAQNESNQLPEKIKT